MVMPGMALRSAPGDGAGIDIPGIAEWSIGAAPPGMVWPACASAAAAGFAGAFGDAARRAGAAGLAFAFGWAF